MQNDGPAPTAADTEVITGPLQEGEFLLDATRGASVIVLGVGRSVGDHLFRPPRPRGRLGGIAGRGGSGVQAPGHQRGANVRGGTPAGRDLDREAELTMDFGWSTEQETYRDVVRRFAQNELNVDLLQRDAESDFSRAAWEKCAGFGIQGLPVDPAYGGTGADALTIVLALESLGYGCRDNGLLFSLNAHMWSAQVPIHRYGTEEQKQRYLPGLVDGSTIGVQAVTEPGSGSDAMGGMATTALAKEDGYVLNGSKTFITNAPVADVFVVFALTDPARGWAGVSAFVIERDTPGLDIGRPFNKMGLRTSPMSELFFADCVVPSSALLGRAGAGLAIFTTSMDWERSFILATAVGTMERQLEDCVKYARERKQFGQAIGKFQAVSHKIVDMRLRLKAARLGLYHLAWLRDQKKSTKVESAEVKLAISEAFVQSSMDALFIHGASGYMVESELDRDLPGHDRRQNLLGHLRYSAQCGGAGARPVIGTVHDLLAGAAIAHPTRPAVIDGDRQVTYAELDARANQLAHLLIELGVGRGDRVAIYLDKALESVVAIYGTMKAGAAYVPLDPNAPAPRLAYIAANCAVACLIAGAEKSEHVATLVADASIASLVVINDDAGAAALDRQPTSLPDVAAISLDLAYILYTSGSTGAPKGVMLSHQNCRAFVDWAVQEFAIGPDDRLSSHAPLHFDLSTFDLFAAAEAARRSCSSRPSSPSSRRQSPSSSSSPASRPGTRCRRFSR